MYVYIIVFDEMKKVEYFVKLTVTKCIFVVLFVMTGCNIIIFTIYYTVLHIFVIYMHVLFTGTLLGGTRSRCPSFSIFTLPWFGSY